MQIESVRWIKVWLQHLFETRKCTCLPDVSWEAVPQQGCWHIKWLIPNTIFSHMSSKKWSVQWWTCNGSSNRFCSMGKEVCKVIWCNTMKTFKNIHAYFEFDALPYWQPVKFVNERWRTVTPACREYEFSSFVLKRLQTIKVLSWGAIQECIAVVKARENETANDLMFCVLI